MSERRIERVARARARARARTTGRERSKILGGGYIFGLCYYGVRNVHVYLYLDVV